MLMSLNEASALIMQGKLLHISGNEGLLKGLPKGNWIGGSTEYFMSSGGGMITGELLNVRVLDYQEFRISSYDENTISGITEDAYPNGFTILIVPLDSAVLEEYAKSASSFDGIFLKNIVGWVSGANASVAGQLPAAVNGETGETFSDRAVALHVSLPDDKLVLINIVNIFSPDENGPVVEFLEDGFSVSKCLVDGKETFFSDYIAENGINTRLPIIGNFSGALINTSVKNVEEGAVRFFAPVFRGIAYRFAKNIDNYAEEFKARLRGISDTRADFCCNCYLNFLYGELEGQDIGAFYGPLTFGEIAYQLVNQTLVYLQVR